MVIHAQIQIGEKNDRCLELLSQIKTLRRHIKALLGVSWQQQHMFRVSVGSVSRQLNIRLLRPRRHSGTWSGPLHIDKDSRHFRKISQTEKFVHQRQTRTTDRKSVV